MSGTVPEGTEQPVITTTTTTTTAAAAAAEADEVTNTTATTMESPNQPTQNETQNITPGSGKNLLKDFCGGDFERKYASESNVKNQIKNTILSVAFMVCCNCHLYVRLGS